MFSLFFAAVITCQDATAALPQAADVARVLAVPPRALDIAAARTADGGPTLVGVLESYARATGWELQLEETLANQLGKEHVDFLDDVHVAPERVHTFVEALLQTKGLVLRFTRASSPVRFEVRDWPRLREPVTSALLIERSMLPLWEKHPAILIACDVELEGADPARWLELRPLAVRFESTGDAAWSMRWIGGGPDIANVLEVWRTGTESPHGSRMNVLFPRGTESLTLGDLPPAGSDVADALAKFGTWSERSVLVDRDARALLGQFRRRPGDPSVLRPEAVHGYVDALLARGGCVLLPTPVREPLFWRVVRKMDLMPPFAITEAPLVSFDDVTALIDRRAMVLQAVLRLPSGATPRFTRDELCISGSAADACAIRELPDPRFVSLIGTPERILAAARALREPR